jgi:hypothetical protein
MLISRGGGRPCDRSFGGESRPIHLGWAPSPTPLNKRPHHSTRSQLRHGAAASTVAGKAQSETFRFTGADSVWICIQIAVNCRSTNYGESISMLRLGAVVVIGLLAITSLPVSATAAGLYGHRAHAHTTYTYRIPPKQWRGCPDRYSCYSLYGAYGPYGGAAYWSAYSPVGWDDYSPLK